MRRFGVPWLLWLALVLGCSGHERLLAPRGVEPATLAGGTFDLVARDVAGSVVLRGQLHLGPIVGTAIGGTWELGRWEGSEIPGLPGRGSVRGSVFGRAAMLQLDVEQKRTIGIVVDREQNGRVTGTISLLPSRSPLAVLEALPAR